MALTRNEVFIFKSQKLTSKIIVSKQLKKNYRTFCRKMSETEIFIFNCCKLQKLLDYCEPTCFISVTTSWLY